MPPRRSARVAAVAERESSALSPLPHAVVLHIFSLLPADERARAACVCRGWCHVLLERSLWTRLNLSPSSGVRVRVTDAVLAGAAAKARGQLTALDVRGCGNVRFDALLGVVQANAGALRELCAGVCEYGLLQTLDADRVERLSLAAPQLTACHADVLGASSAANARRMLRNEPPFQPLRLRVLRVHFDEGVADENEASVVALAADLAAHASLQRVELVSAPINTLTALDAVVDAALALQIVSLRFITCRMLPASAPALARLLGGDALKTLYVYQDGQQLLDSPSAALVGSALRANVTLTELFLANMGLWHNPDAAAALLSALTSHPSVRKLSICHNHLDAAHTTVAGAALGALVAANAPALMELDVSLCSLGDAGLRPLFDALPANTHLRTLNVSWNDTSDAFVRDVLLPAVRANTSLRTLHAANFGAVSRDVLEATALVAARGGGGGGGAA
jgi:hypothetical protein